MSHVDLFLLCVPLPAHSVRARALIPSAVAPFSYRYLRCDTFPLDILCSKCFVQIVGIFIYIPKTALLVMKMMKTTGSSSSYVWKLLLFLCVWLLGVSLQ